MSDPTLTVSIPLVAADPCLLDPGLPGAGPVPERPEPAHPAESSASLKTKALHGSFWTIVGFFSAQVLRFASNLILTRFLKPEVFGLMALVLTFIFGVSLFSDFGLGASIVQNKRGDDRGFLNTAWTIQVIRGFGIWFVLCALAYPAAHWYHHPELLTFLPVCGLVAVFSGLNSTAIYSLNRHMAVGTLTKLMLAMQLVSMTITIGWAAFSPTIWALVMGQLIGPFFYMIVSHFLNWGDVVQPRRSNRFEWDPTAYLDLLHFGKWIFVGTILFFMQSQVDRIVFDKIFHNLALLGVYATALQFAQLPSQVVGNLASSTLLPIFARGAQFDGNRVFQEMGPRLVAIRRLILPASVAAVLGIVLAGPLFFKVLYKHAYQDAGWMTRLMAPGIWFAILQLSADRILQAAGHLKTLAMINGINLVFTVAGGFVGDKIALFPGFILGLAAGNLAGQLLVELMAAWQGVSLWRQDLFYTLLLVALGAAGIGLTRLLERVTHHAMLPAMISTTVFVGGTALWAAQRALRRVR